MALKAERAYWSVQLTVAYPDDWIKHAFLINHFCFRSNTPLNRSLQTSVILEETQEHRVESFGTTLPVLITEALAVADGKTYGLLTEPNTCMPALRKYNNLFSFQCKQWLNKM